MLKSSHVLVNSLLNRNYQFRLLVNITLREFLPVRSESQCKQHFWSYSRMDLFLFTFDRFRKLLSAEKFEDDEWDSNRSSLETKLTFYHLPPNESLFVSILSLSTTFTHQSRAQPCNGHPWPWLISPSWTISLRGSFVPKTAWIYGSARSIFAQSAKVKLNFIFLFYSVQMFSLFCPKQDS